MIVLRDPQSPTTNRFEKWLSLVLAPWVARLARGSQLARDVGVWFDRYGLKYGEALSRC